MQEFDVIVLGGGIVGAAAARAAAIGNAAAGRPSARVLLLDARKPGHEYGSSHGDGRIVRFTYPEAPYLAMAKEAYPAWANIERDSGRQLIETTGGWESAPAGHSALAELEAGMTQAGIALERLNAEQSRRRFPHFAISDHRQVLYQSDGAIVRADRAVDTLWQLTAAAGAQVAGDHRVEEIVGENDGVLVSGRRAAGSPFSFRGRRLILAAGGWSGPLLEKLGLRVPLTVSREVVAYFLPRPGTKVDHRVGQMPTLIDYDGDKIFYALPQIQIPGVKVGWHHSGPKTAADAQTEADPEVLAGVTAYVRRRLPHLDPNPTKILTCLYTDTPDYHFILDRHPSLPQVTVAAGFSGHGFKFGPVLGEILAQLAADRTPSLDIDMFRIDRFTGPVQRRNGA